MSHAYKNLEFEQQEELLSGFLINSWSYSKISSFARNEKSFEMQHIYGLYSRLSVSSIAGNAYHTALEYYFNNLKEGNVLPLAELEASAFLYLEGVPANKWRLGKTTPTIEEAVINATKTVTALLKNFYTEKALYEDDIAEILFVELGGEVWVTCNGVDIPLPCRFKIDLVVRLKTGDVVIVDHKSKRVFTDEDEAVLSIGVQAMTYVLCLEEMTGLKVSEVWFMENKYSQNKDKSAQMARIPVKIDENSRRLYEALLYEPVKRMIAAVRDPDYIYLINDSDAFSDKAEIYEFWCRTMLNEFSVEDFNIDESKKALVAKRLKKVRDSGLTPINPSIIRHFKENATKFIQYDLSVTNMTPQQKIEHVLKTFGVQAQVAHTFEGYSSNTFLLEVGAGVKVASIFKYRLDLANGLDVENVRMSPNLVRYQEKSYLSVEISKKREKNLLYTSTDRKDNSLPVGIDNYGRVIYWNLDNQSTPHALVCGATGSGKSVWLRSTIEFAREARVKDIIILDPKEEFSDLAGPGVDVISNIELIELALAGCVEEMNRRVKEKRSSKTLIIFDEFADAVANARKRKDLEDHEQTLGDNLRLLLQKGRSAGFRVVAATQRASVKVINGDSKVNFPVQICFRVPKEADSRVVLDEAGAESLAGAGDGLIKSPEYMDIVRFQAYYLPQNQTA